MRELVERMQVLALGDSQPALLANPGVSLEVVRERRLLQPEHVVLREELRRAHGLLDGPRVVGVDGEHPIRPDELADGGDARDVLLQCGAPEFDFDALEALGEVGLDAAQQLRLVVGQVDPARVAPRAAVEAAEHAPQRLARALALEVPQGDVHGADGEGGDPAARDVVHVPRHRVVQPLDPPGVLPRHAGREVRLDHRLDRQAPLAARVGVTHALFPRGVGDAHDDELEVRVVAVLGVHQHLRQRHAVQLARHRGLRGVRGGVGGVGGRVGWGPRGSAGRTMVLLSPAASSPSVRARFIVCAGTGRRWAGGGVGVGAQSVSSFFFSFLTCDLFLHVVLAGDGSCPWR